ncbi:hypothetical protein PENSPDRAFT_735302 [Peniophora sp. CONT]|nr:hypothetical protein PENSPDRAFT_735302 [Peniophora sp. CONT]
MSHTSAPSRRETYEQRQCEREQQEREQRLTADRAVPAEDEYSEEAAMKRVTHGCTYKRIVDCEGPGAMDVEGESTSRRAGGFHKRGNFRLAHRLPSRTRAPRRLLRVVSRVLPSSLLRIPHGPVTVFAPSGVSAFPSASHGITLAFSARPYCPSMWGSELLVHIVSAHVHSFHRTTRMHVQFTMTLSTVNVVARDGNGPSYRHAIWYLLWVVL